MSSPTADPVLAIRSLVTEIRTEEGVLRPVDQVDLSIAPGETLCLVGESGCGKSMLALSIMGVLPAGASIVSGSVQLGGRELVGLPESDLRAIRGRAVAMVPQDPMTAFDPLYSIGDQIAETIRVHTGCSKAKAREGALTALTQVHLPDPPRVARAIPSELSGGMNQRALIAMALSTRPIMLIADEPTTALDVTVQAQVIELLQELQRSHDMAVLLITHDMGVAAMVANRVVVMYGGRVAEEAQTQAIFAGARHPYTVGLIGAAQEALSADARFRSIPGAPPNLLALPDGCAFAPRCAWSKDACSRAVPPLRTFGDSRAACVLEDDERPWLRNPRSEDRRSVHA
jgi:oligopeptide/dipeptide ABC transporter ATP-binding protein